MNVRNCILSFWIPSNLIYESCNCIFVHIQSQLSKEKKIYVLQVEKISEFLVIGFLKIYFLMRVGEAWLLETYTLILQYQKWLLVTPHARLELSEKISDQFQPYYFCYTLSVEIDGEFEFLSTSLSKPSYSTWNILELCRPSQHILSKNFKRSIFSLIFRCQNT